MRDPHPARITDPVRAKRQDLPHNTYRICFISIDYGLARRLLMNTRGGDLHHRLEIRR